MARPRQFDEDRVLDAVMETFWCNGYEGTSAQDLVDATGLGRGSLYAAYASKDGLFEQALRRYHQNARAHVDRMSQAPSAVTGLRMLMTEILDADLDRSKQRGCFATNSAIEMAGRDPRIANLVRSNFTILIRGIEETVRRGQAENEIPAEADPAALALFIFNAVQGLRVLTKTTAPTDRSKLIAVIDRTLAALG